MVGFTGQELMQGLRAAEQGVKQGWSSQMSGKGASVQQPNEIGAMSGGILASDSSPRFDTRGSSTESSAENPNLNSGDSLLGDILLTAVNPVAGATLAMGSAIDEINDATSPRKTFVFKPAVAPQMQTDPRKQKPSSSYGMK